MTSNLKTKKIKQISLRSYMLGIAVLWSLLIALSLGWNLKIKRSITLEGARIEARTAFEKDITYRRWNAEHGEIYAPMTEATPANPFLDVPERDITTLLGKKLTQINPAYMTRQAHELAKKASGVKGHITSLNPIRPANAPDNWETRALKAFQTGIKEVSFVEEIEGENYMRLMRPLLIEKACLKCHAKQGYKLGDIRGGLSVSIPLAPRMAIERSYILTVIAGHGLFWVAGLFGIGFGMRRLNQQIHERIEAKKSLQESEEKYRSLVESTEDSIYLIDENLRYLFANKKIQSRFGLPMDKVIGRKYGDFHSREETKNFAEKVNKVFETTQSLSYEYRSKRDNRYFIRTLSPVKEPDKKVTALTLISKNITKHKLAEESLKQANEKILRSHYQRKILSKRLIDLLEKDRRQIAMELHDHIGQTLTSLKIDLEITHNQLEDLKHELRPRIKALQEKTVQIMKDVKNISHGLRPTMIDLLGIVSSFRNLFSEIKQQTGMEIRFFNRGIPKRFEEEKELAIYRIAQEALNNIIKHARAENVFVNLVKKDDKLALSVEDDGVGFSKDEAMKITRVKGPLGLLIMRERAIQFDGEFTIESQPGKGTHLLVEIPL